MRQDQQVETLQDVVDFVEELRVTGPDDDVSRWLPNFATVTEPESTFLMHQVTLHSGGGGVSRKPGNIVLNWRKLFDVGPDALVAGSAIESNTPFVRGLIGLYVWNKVWRGAEEVLSDAEASVIESLWLDHGRNRRVTSDDAFTAVNGARRVAGLTELARGDFERTIDRLIAMHCVEVENDEIWLREWVRRKS